MSGVDSGQRVLCGGLWSWACWVRRVGRCLSRLECRVELKVATCK